MKTGTIKPPPDEKPALHPTKAQTKHPVSLPVHPVLDAWLARPLRQPENLLGTLRNRAN
jgi:hypothetical protein